MRKFINKNRPFYIVACFSALLSGCSPVPDGGYSDYTIGTNIKILGHAFHNFMLSLKIYNKMYIVILFLLFVAMLVSLHEEKLFNFFKHGLFTGIGLYLFIMLFDPVLKTISWIVNLFAL